MEMISDYKEFISEAKIKKKAYGRLDFPYARISDTATYLNKEARIKYIDTVEDHSKSPL